MDERRKNRKKKLTLEHPPSPTPCTVPSIAWWSCWSNLRSLSSFTSTVVALPCRMGVMVEMIRSASLVSGTFVNIVAIIHHHALLRWRGTKIRTFQ